MNFTEDFAICYHLKRYHFDTDGLSIPILDCVLNTATSITATLGNLLVLVSIWRNPSLHMPSNILLMGLSLSDLGVGVVVQPLFVVFNVAKINRLSDVFCTSAMLSYVMAFALVGISLLTATAVSIDRYLALYLHLRYQEIVTIERVIAVLVTIWTICIAIGTTWLWNSTLYKLAGIFTILPCVSFTLFIYYKIYRIVRRHQIQIQAQAHVQEEQSSKKLNLTQIKKSTVNMFIVFCLYLLFYLPFLCTAIATLVLGGSVYRQSVAELTTTILCINSTLNPFVYCWRMTEIRAAVKRTVSDLICFRNP